MPGLDVVIPAGGQMEEAFARVTGSTCKPLVKFGNKTVIRTTIEALRGSPRINRIVVVGSDEVINHEDMALVTAALPEKGSGPKNIMVGIEHLQTLDLPPDRVLIVTSDLPFLTPATVDSFLDLCDHEIDFNVPLIERPDYEEAYPGAEATFVKLLDGEWTTGCMYEVSVRGFRTALTHIEDVFQRRKSKLGIARLLGFKFVWDYLNKKLTVPDIEAKITELLRVRGRAVPGSPPELAYDIDYIEDYQYAVAFKSKVRPMESAEPTA